MPDERDAGSPVDRPRRPSWQRVGAIAGSAAALLIAVGAWLLPEPLEWVCDVTEGRAFRCNDVPSDYLGEWTGTETCHEESIFTCAEREYTLALTIRRGRVDKEAVVTSRSESDGKPLCESFWTLERAGDEALEFHVERSRFVSAPDSAGTMTGCPGDLAVRLHLTEQHALELEIRSGGQTVPPFPGGVLMFTGTLQKR